AMESNTKFRYLCVCSDQTVDSQVDSNNISLSDIDIPISTDSSSVALFLSKSLEDTKNIIFCTYQSSNVLKEALKLENHSFDLAIYDEAHRTAGIGSSNAFSNSVSDEYIPAKSKLFMTATERLMRPSISKKATELGAVVFSMNDRSLYGEVFHCLTFGEAIRKNIVADYRIVFSGINTLEFETIIKKNSLIKDENDGLSNIEAFDTL